MAQSNLLNKYIWLVNLIYQHDGITRDEINRRWSASNINDDHESEIPERTFHRYKKEIQTLFDIEIQCNRRGNKTYSIANRNDINSDYIKSWLLNSFAVNAMFNEARNLMPRILLEPIPSGQQYLQALIEAMHNDEVVTLHYQSFHMNEPKPHVIEPYCMKVYKQRWYVLGRRTDTGLMRIFALDRVKDIEPTGHKFQLPPDFDAETYFADSIGIIVVENMKAHKVTFRATGGQQDYIRSLPLHSTQREIQRNDQESIFELRVRPSYDLLQELLRYGEDVEVLSPAGFREQFRTIATRMNHTYNAG